MNKTKQDRHRLLQQKLQLDKTDRHSQGITGIKTLEEILRSLKIIEEYILEENRTIELTLEKMSIVPVSAIHDETAQVVMLKSIVLDLRWFDGNQTKFEDQWRGIQLFKSNRFIATDNKIIAILVQLRECVVEIYVQKKINQMKEKDNILDQNDFIKEIKTEFGNKSKAADTRQKIKIFKQGKKHIADFIIEFKALTMKQIAYTSSFYQRRMAEAIS